MTARTTNYYWWSLKQELINMFSHLLRTAEIIGHSRAASELTRMGYHEEAKRVMMNLKDLRNGR